MNGGGCGKTSTKVSNVSSSAWFLVIDSSSPSISSVQMTVCQDTPEGDESDDSASLSTNQSQSALAGDVNGQVDGQKDYERVSYDSLTHSLGLDPVFTALEPPFDAHQVNGSPMDASKPRIVRCQWAKEEESDSWNGLVVEGSDPPPSLFNASSSGLDLPDMVSPSLMVTRRKVMSWNRTIALLYADEGDLTLHKL